MHDTNRVNENLVSVSEANEAVGSDSEAVERVASENLFLNALRPKLKVLIIFGWGTAFL